MCSCYPSVPSSREPAAGVVSNAILPMAGAVAVVCDDCLATDAPVKFACIGPAGDNARIAIEFLTIPFDHDMTKHDETSYV